MKKIQLTAFFLGSFYFVNAISAQKEWYKTFGNAPLSTDFVKRTLVDKQGNIYLVGKDDSLSAGDVNVQSGCYLRKLDSLGTVLWQKNFANKDVNINDFEINSTGDLFLLMNFKEASTIIFNKEFKVNRAIFDDYGSNGETIVARLNADGQMKWVTRMPYLRYSQGFGNYIGCDTDGNAYISWETYDGGDGYARYLTKLNASDGSMLWRKYLTNDGGVYFNSMITDNLGNVYLGGSFPSDSVHINDKKYVYGAKKPFTCVKFNSAGEVVWVSLPKNSESVSGQSSGLNSEALKLSTDGTKLYMVGYAPPNTQFDAAKNNGENHNFVAQLNAQTGAFNWINTIGKGVSFSGVYTEGVQTWVQIVKNYYETSSIKLEDGSQPTLFPSTVYPEYKDINKFYLVPVNEATGGFKSFNQFAENENLYVLYAPIGSVYVTQNRVVLSSFTGGKVFGADSIYFTDSPRGFYIFSGSKTLLNPSTPSLKLDSIVSNGVCGDNPVRIKTTTSKMRFDNNFRVDQELIEPIQGAISGNLLLKARQLDTITKPFNDIFSFRTLGRPYKVRICATSPAACSDFIEMYPTKITPLVKDYICFGDTIQLKASKGLTYEWIPKPIMADAKSQNTVAKPDTVTGIKLKTKLPVGCTMEDSVVIKTVHPVFDLPDTVKLACNDFDDIFTLNASPKGGLYAPNDLYYTWKNPSSDVYFNSFFDGLKYKYDKTIKEVYPSKSGLYTLHVRDSVYKCSFRDTTRLIMEDCKILKGVTPTPDRLIYVEVYQKTPADSANWRLVKEVYNATKGKYLVRLPMKDSAKVRFLTDWANYPYWSYLVESPMYYDSTMFIQDSKTVKFSNVDTLKIDAQPWFPTSANARDAYISGYVFDYFRPNEPVKNLKMVLLDTAYYNDKRQYGDYGGVAPMVTTTDSAGRYSFATAGGLGRTFQFFGDRMDFKIDTNVAAKVVIPDKADVRNFILYKKDSSLVACNGIDCGVINGVVYLDKNANCKLDTSDRRLANQIMQINPGNILISTSDSGKYTTRLKAGNYTVTTLLPQYSAESCVSGGTNILNISVTGNSVSGNFAVRPKPNVYDVTCNLTANGGFRPGFETDLFLDVSNKGTVEAPLQVIFRYTDTVTIVNSSPQPTSNVNNQLTWTIPQLVVSEKRRFTIRVKTKPDVTYIGKKATFVSQVNLTNAQIDADLKNNMDSVSQTITGSFDPNDKQVVPKGSYLANQVLPNVQKYDFQIRFQNTGTDTAFTVVVKDTLNDIWNPATLQPLTSSHPYKFNLEKNKIAIWTFDNILLPDSFRNEIKSHGFLKFSIEPKAIPLSIGTALKNKAAIFFDFNPPVITNEVNLQVVSKFFSPTQDIQSIVRIYPNPAFEKLEVELKDFSTPVPYDVYNTSGQLIFSGILNTSFEPIKINNLIAGSYQLVLKRGEQKQNITFLKF
jgi:hypothetical protein